MAEAAGPPPASDEADAGGARDATARGSGDGADSSPRRRLSRTSSDGAEPSSRRRFSGTSSDGGDGSLDSPSAQLSPLSTQGDDVLQVQRFFRLYRAGALSVSRVRKPRALAKGGSLSSLLEERGDAELGAEAAFYEANGFMRPLRPTDMETRLGVQKRSRLPEIALDAPALKRCARLAVIAFGAPDSTALVNIVGDRAVTTGASDEERRPSADTAVASHATASYDLHGYVSDPAGYDANLCAHTSESEEPVFIDDLRDDWRFANTQKVRTGSCNAYYGVPIFLRVGVLGSEPRGLGGHGSASMPDFVRRSSDETTQSAGSTASPSPPPQRVQIGSLCIASSRPQPGREIPAAVERRMRALGDLIGSIIEGLVAQVTLVRDIAVRHSLDQLIASVGQVTEQHTTRPVAGTVMTRTPQQTPEHERSAPPFGAARSNSVSSTRTSTSSTARSRPVTPRQATLAATYSANVDAGAEAQAVAALTFSEAADMLRTQLGVSFVVVLDLRDTLPEALPDGGYENRVLGASVEPKRDDDVRAALASANVGPLLREATGLTKHSDHLVSLSDGGASARAQSVWRDLAALLDLVVTDAQGALQFVMLVGSFEPRMRFGPSELSIARVVGTVLLSRLSVSRLLDSSAAGAAFVSQASHDLRSPCVGPHLRPSLSRQTLRTADAARAAPGRGTADRAESVARDA